MTTSWSRAKAIYEGSDLEIIALWCLNNGFVYATEDFFVAGYYTFLQECNNMLDKPDMIHISVAAGSMKKAFEAVNLEGIRWLRFERQDENIRVYDIKRFERLIYGRHGRETF